MKRLAILGMVFMMLMIPPLQVVGETIRASGMAPETIRVGSSILVDDICTFSIKSTKPYDVFMNTESGDAADFLVVTFDIINWMTEPLYLRTQAKATMVYDESFDFEPAYLWGNPGGTYYRIDGNQNLIVYRMDDSGAITSNGSDGKGGYVDTKINFHNGYDRLYYPEIDAFYFVDNLNENEKHYNNIDGSKTVLDPLVQRTMHYVFKVPNIVVKDEGLRVFTLSIGENDYQLTF